MLYVPDLADTLLSVKDHLAFNNCSIFGSNNKMFLKYPAKVLEASMDQEIHLLITPTPSHTKVPACFNAKFAPLAPNIPSSTMVEVISNTMDKI